MKKKTSGRYLANPKATLSKADIEDNRIARHYHGDLQYAGVIKETLKSAKDFVTKLS